VSKGNGANSGGSGKKVKKVKKAKKAKEVKGVDLERLDMDMYKKICQGNTSINNSYATLTLQDCDGRKLKFKLDFVNSTVREKVFEFDFRFYNPYRSGGALSGLYVFKTDEFESNPYDHAISSI
jgi:hypothetical protein